jgi:zinc transport system substrate-binding protein
MCWVLLLPSALTAEVPNVATDIAPVHSLVARVMLGVGAPELIVRQGASPHEYALRPSEAAALAHADLVIWMGPELTPWMQGAVETLAAEAVQVALLAADQTVLHGLRQGAQFEADHDHEGVDPHAWLDPVNGQNWLRMIADELSALDPEHAGLYAANATKGVAELDQVKLEIERILTPLRGIRYLVYHDAYQYFEVRFDISASGAVMAGDADIPGPARLVELRRFVADEGLTCLLHGPQTDPRLRRAIFPQGAKTGILDPMGSVKQPGTGLYPALLLDLAKGYEGCAG